MAISKKIKDEVKSMGKKGDALKKIRAYLTMEDVSNKEAEALIVELKLGGSKPKGFADSYYEYLSAEKRSKDEATAFILAEDNSKNVHAHKSHYLNIWALTVKVWEAKA